MASALPLEREDRTRRGEEKLSAILAAARIEFCQRGLLGANIERIAKSAGVTKQAVYYHYVSREALYQAVLQEMNESLVTRIVRASFREERAIDSIIAFFSLVYERYRSNPEGAKLALDYNFHGSIHFKFRGIQRRAFAKYAGIIQRGAADGSISGDLDPLTAFQFAMNLIGACFLARDRAWGVEPKNDEAQNAYRREQVLKAIRALYCYRADGEAPPFEKALPSA